MGKCPCMTENKQRHSWMNPQKSQRFSSQSASFAANGYGTNKRLARRLLITGRPRSEWNHRLMARLLMEQTRRQRPLRAHAETNPSPSTEHTAPLTLLCFTSAARPPCPQPSRHPRRHLLKKKKKKRESEKEAFIRWTVELTKKTHTAPMCFTAGNRVCRRLVSLLCTKQSISFRGSCLAVIASIRQQSSEDECGRRGGREGGRQGGGGEQGRSN